MAEKIGPFILGETLGEGSTGKVKQAVHKDTGQKVAIKIINKAILTDKPSLRRKVEREIAVMKLINHKHVIRLFDVLQTKKYLFLIIEHVEGGELFEYIVNNGRLSVEEAFHFFKQILEGLEYCHQNLICHRDLKPENLLLDGNKNIKIADFGMASLMEEGKLLETSCGSPHYASPEVVKGLKYNGTEADVWSMGVILFALLTGRLPFDDSNLQNLLRKVKQGQYVVPTYLSGDVKDLISQMLCMDPEKRIDLSSIKKHPWYRRLDKQLTTLSVSGMNIPTFEQLKKEKKLKKLRDAAANNPGATAVTTPAKEEDDEEFIAQVLQEEQDNIKVQAESLPDDQEDDKVQNKTDDAPIHDVEPEIMQAVQDQLGISDRDKLKSLLSEGKNIEVVAYRLIKKRRDETGTTHVESYHPKMSISATNPIEDETTDKAALLRKKLIEAIHNNQDVDHDVDNANNASGSSAANSAQRKVPQWFSFWKKKPTSAGSGSGNNNQVKSQFGRHSVKPQEEILAELSRSFKALQIQWSMVNDSTIRATCDVGEGGYVVEFDVTMSTVPDGDGYFLNFNKVSGEIYTARILFDVLQDELKI
ncbi:serine/threonine-protein kinase [Acrasis kona]|uniref:Serine/threonine-protein kinase n=1 Tax=Acrasis kona TaxID=1008807 RepID=A0AAW2YYA5_9EUKA